MEQNDANVNSLAARKIASALASVQSTGEFSCQHLTDLPHISCSNFLIWYISPPRKRCDVEGCNNVSVQAGKCKSHGASSKKCDEPGCNKMAALNGLCKRHSDNRETLESASQAAEGDSGASLPVPVPGVGMTMSEYMQMAAAHRSFAAFHPIAMMAMPSADPAAMSMMAQHSYGGYMGMGGLPGASMGMGGMGEMYCGVVKSKVEDGADAENEKPAAESAQAEEDIKADPKSEEEEPTKEW
jgi:hypothetical protein